MPPSGKKTFIHSTCTISIIPTAKMSTWCCANMKTTRICEKEDLFHNLTKKTGSRLFRSFLYTNAHYSDTHVNNLHSANPDSQSAASSYPRPVTFFFFSTVLNSLSTSYYTWLGFFSKILNLANVQSSIALIDETFVRKWVDGSQKNTKETQPVQLSVQSGLIS